MLDLIWPPIGCNRVFFNPNNNSTLSIPLHLLQLGFAHMHEPPNVDRLQPGGDSVNPQGLQHGDPTLPAYRMHNIRFCIPILVFLPTHLNALTNFTKLSPRVRLIAKLSSAYMYILVWMLSSFRAKLILYLVPST